MSGKEILNQLVREQFYENVQLLIELKHSENFKLYNDDLINSDKCSDLIHFLLTSLDEKQFYKRFNWPLSDRKSETEFRRDAIKYLNELNHLYKIEPPLPPISLQNIHLTTKSDQFISFMFMLSQFVLERIAPADSRTIHSPKLGLSQQDTDTDLAKLRSLFAIYQLDNNELETTHNGSLQYLEQFEKLVSEIELEPYRKFQEEYGKFMDLITSIDLLKNNNEKLESLLDSLKSKMKNVQKESISLKSVVQETSSLADKISQRVKSSLNSLPKNPFLAADESQARLELIYKSLEECIQLLDNL